MPGGGASRVLRPFMSRGFDPDAVDLAQVAAHLASTVGQAVAGAVVGRTILRDAVVARLDCSELEAENLVETLITRGFVRKVEPPDGPPIWEIGAR